MRLSSFFFWQIIRNNNDPWDWSFISELIVFIWIFFFPIFSAVLYFRAGSKQRYDSVYLHVGTKINQKPKIICLFVFFMYAILKNNRWHRFTRTHINTTTFDAKKSRFYFCEWKVQVFGNHLLILEWVWFGFCSQFFVSSSNRIMSVEWVFAWRGFFIHIHCEGIFGRY